MPAARAVTVARLRRAVGTHRRLLAAGFAAAAVAAGLNVVAPSPPDTTTVVTAATDLQAGVTLRRQHLDLVDLPEELVPHGALVSGRQAFGRVLTSPLRAGEPLTDVRLVGKALIDGYGGGRVAVPVRIADAGSVALVRTGDRIDVLAADPKGLADTAVVALAAPVVVVPDPDSATEQGTSGALIVIAVTPTVAKEVAKASVLGPLSVALRG